MADSFAAKLGRLGSESLVYGLSSIVGRLLSFLLQPYYAHHFDPAQNGVQSVVYSYVPIISIAFYLGMDVAYMRSASDFAEHTDEERQRAFTAPMTAIAGLGAVALVIGLTFASWFAPLVRLDVTSFRYMMGIVYTDALLAVPYAYLRMASKSVRYAILRLLYVVISVALNIVLIGHLRWGVRAIFFANVVANLAVLALLTSDIVRQLRPAQLGHAPWRSLWKYALPIMPAMLAVMLIENGDRIVLNYLPASTALRVYGMSVKDVIGIYGFNYKLGVAMLLVVQMFRMAWMPFALQHARDSRAPQLFSRVLTALTLTCSAVFLTVSLWLPELVRIPAVYHYVRPGYWTGLPIVPVILLGYVISGIYTVVTTGLYIERQTGVLPWISGAGAVLNIAMCVIAARTLGMVAVAWATPAAYALMAVLGTWRSQRVFAVPFEWRRLARVGTIVAIIFALDAVLSPHLSLGVALGFKILLLAAFPGVLFATRFFRPGELRAMHRLMIRLRPSIA